MSSNLIQRIVSSLFLILISFYIIINGSTFFNIFLIIVFFISIFEWYKMSFKKLYFYPGIFFLFFSFYTVFLMRSNDSYLLNFFIIFFICIFTDIGGYFFGKLFKGPKLSKISPNKTYSGVLGSFIFSAFFTFYLIYFLNYFFDNQIHFDYKILINICIISLVSQIGDLIVSLFKRLANKKDTGNIIPGHGGLLDRIDGMIFALPFSYWLNLI